MISLVTSPCIELHRVNGSKCGYTNLNRRHRVLPLQISNRRDIVSISVKHLGQRKSSINQTGKAWSLTARMLRKKLSDRNFLKRGFSQHDSSVSKTNIRIGLVSVLSVVLFIIVTYAVAIPEIRSVLFVSRMKTSRELTRAAWNLLHDYNNRVQSGEISIEVAQKRAIKSIRELRYGPDDSSCFWIINQKPEMIMHPYRTDLENHDLSGFTDPDGNHLFVEMVDIVEENDAGFVEYTWQWNDQSERLEKKVSYVMGFGPWNWIVGTGIYMIDVEETAASFTRRFLKVLLIMLAILILVVTYFSIASIRQERKKAHAEQQLRRSEKRLRTVIDSGADAILAVDEEGKITLFNSAAEELFGASAEEMTGRMPTEIVKFRWR